MTQAKVRYCSKCGCQMIPYRNEKSKRFDSETGKRIVNFTRCGAKPWYNWILPTMHDDHRDYFVT